MKEYIVCYLTYENDSDFSDPMTYKEALKFIKKSKKEWYKYYLTKIEEI